MAEIRTERSSEILQKTITSNNIQGFQFRDNKELALSLRQIGQ